eukprot:2634785-Rhodomonas_salina.1
MEGPFGSRVLAQRSQSESGDSEEGSIWEGRVSWDLGSDVPSGDIVVTSVVVHTAFSFTALASYKANGDVTVSAHGG